MTKQINIPIWLREFHGDQASLLSLLATYVAGGLLGLYCYALTDLSTVWQTILLIVLAVDIGGGAVANLSDGTSLFYKTRPTFRWVFIGLHSIHILLLWLVYPAAIEVLAIGGMILLFTLIVNIVKGEEDQRLTAILCLLVSLVVIYSTDLEEVLSIILIVYAMKLVLGFAVRWPAANP